MGLFSSCQDEGVGRNPSLPHTTKRRITTNLKSINNQKCQRIKLHGTLTTIELKKWSNRTTRPVRRWMERNQGKAATMLAGQPTARQRAVQVRLTKGELRLRAGCGLWGLPWKEKLPVSNKSSSKSGLERRRQPALFPLWPLPHRQHHGPERRVALTRVIHKAPPPYNLQLNRGPD